MNGSQKDVTRMLQRWSEGDEEALGQLIPVVFEDLRTMARRQLPKRPGVTLQPTDVVSEVYLRLAGVQASGFESRR